MLALSQTARSDRSCLRPEKPGRIAYRRPFRGHDAFFSLRGTPSLALRQR
jgi:hypothetical protein